MIDQMECSHEHMAPLGLWRNDESTEVTTLVRPVRCETCGMEALEHRHIDEIPGPESEITNDS